LNRFELICFYCNNSWEVNYAPQEVIYCPKCKDTNIKIKDNIRDKIDYYAGSPPFKDDNDDDWGL